MQKLDVRMYLPRENAVALLKNYLEATIPGAAVVANEDNSRVAVDVGSKRHVLRMGEAELDDLQTAMTSDQMPITQQNGVKLDTMLTALVSLGVEGVASDVDILKVMLPDIKRDWTTNFKIRGTSFREETAKRIYEGVSALNSLASRQLAQAGGSETSLEKDIEILGNIKTWYETHKHLNGAEVTGESLQYIKAAVGVWLLTLERQKANSTATRVRVAKSKQIFEILQEFWVVHPYNRVPLPQIFFDYVTSQPTVIKPQEIGPSLDIGPLLLKVDARLESRWRGAWETLRSNSSDRVSQAASSMVEVLRQVVNHVRGGEKELAEVLAERYPEEAEFVEATRKYVSVIKNSLESTKHGTTERQVHIAEALMHAAEGIIRTLLR